MNPLIEHREKTGHTGAGSIGKTKWTQEGAEYTCAICGETFKETFAEINARAEIRAVVE